ncbi:MAG: SusC/RagA family TonB-linked outer membrane protein [Bacteroidales bacterium]|nr:SusC/RagA family TonB-linked outer membrane protein [Bacteroidales bacterium]
MAIIVMLAVSPNFAAAQTALKIYGRVVDVAGNPIPGAAVLNKDVAQSGTVTDIDGKFFLSVPKECTLEVSFLGMKTVVVKSVFSKEMVITLEDDLESLKSAVVTGYTEIDRRMLTSSVTTIKAEDLERVAALSIDQMLEGKAAGLQINTLSTTPGAAAKVRVRGSGSFVGSREPLWVIDGIPYEDPVELDAAEINSLDNINLIGNAITGLNPNDIESINVLKDASATAVYGSRAANGVIVITTKRGTSGRNAVSYQGTATVISAPTYDQFNMMNSLDRVDVSREMYQNSMAFKTSGSINPVGYEGALMQYWKDRDYDAFSSKVGAMETLNYNWIKEYYQPAVQQSHSVSMSGGNDSARYYASLAYNKQPGTEIGTGLDRITARINLDVNIRPNVLVGFNIEGYVQKAYYNTGVNAFDEAYYGNRAISPYNEDGSLFYYDRSTGYQDAIPTFSGLGGGAYPTTKVKETLVYGKYSPLHERDVNNYTVDNKGHSFRANLQWDINEDLRWTTLLSYRNTNTNEKKTYDESSWVMTVLRGDDIEDIANRSDKYRALYTVVPTGGLYNASYNESETKLIRNQLNYKKTFEGKHYLNVNLTQEAQSILYKGANNWCSGSYFENQGNAFSKYPQWSPSTYSSATVESNNGLIPYAAIYKAFSGQASNYSAFPTITDKVTNTMSWLGIVTYSYSNLYTVNFNIRNDGSNAFGQYEKNKFRPSWSVSGRWNIHNEKFMDNASWVDELAMRASYGYRGTRPGATPYLTLTNYQQQSLYYPMYSSQLSSLGNSNLKWEKSATVDLALEFSLLKARISGEFDFSYTNATDLLLTRPVSMVNGMASVLYNGGEKDDFNYEFTINAIPIKTKDFTWSLNLNYTYLKEKVIKGADDSYIEVAKYLNGDIVTAGFPVDGFFSYKFTGLNEAGLPTFDGLADQHANEYEKLLNGMVYMGNRLPQHYGGFSTNLRYKRLTLSVVASYKFDYAIRLLKLYGDGTSMPRSYVNLSNDFINRWRVEGDEATTAIPKLNETTTSISAVGITESSVTTGYSTLESMYDMSDVRTVRGDHIRLKSITLSYKVPEFWKINGMTVRLQGQDLGVFCFDKNLKGMDPDQQRSIGMPVLPTYTCALNFSF